MTLKHGRVCHQIFTKGWKSSYHVYTVLQYMNDLLRNPSVSRSLLICCNLKNHRKADSMKTNDAVDELATLKFWTDTETANMEISKYVWG
jgi:ubiquitin-protein ligase